MIGEVDCGQDIMQDIGDKRTGGAARRPLPTLVELVEIDVAQRGQWMIGTRPALTQAGPPRAEG